MAGRIVNHRFKNSGKWFGAKGKVIYSVNTGINDQYSRKTLTVRSGQARLIEEPEEGTTGSLRFVIEWSYGWFGSVDYTFRAFDKLIPPELGNMNDTICFDSTRYSGAWLGDSGIDRINITLPQGQAFSNANMITLSGNAIITNLAEVQGQTGVITLDIEWNYGWFGSCQYSICIASIAIGLSLQLSNLVINPLPAIAGQEVNGEIAVLNNGSVVIEAVDMLIEVTALSLEDKEQWLVDLVSEETRTQEVFNNRRTLNLSPGAQSVEALSLKVLETIPAPVNASSAGVYRLVLKITLPGGTALASIKLEPFIIVKPN